MAKKSLFQTIKDFFKGDKSSSKVKKASRVSNYGGGGYSSSYRTSTSVQKNEEDEKEKQRQRLAEQQKQTTAKLAEIAKVSQRTDALSSGKKSLPPDPKEQKRVNSGVSRAVNKMAKKSESYAERALKQTGNAPTPLAPKLNKNEKYDYGLDSVATRKATNRKDEELAKYNADKKERDKVAASLESKIDAKYRDGSKETAQRIKSGEMTSDPDVAIYEMAKHPGLTSFVRGAASGATLGASELAIKKLPTSKEMREAEEYYQQNKRKGAEFAGEMVGSLATFGLTGGMSKEAVAKAAPKTMQGIENAATRKLLNSRLIRRAAEKEAIERFGIEGATKEVIEEIVKRRAATAAAEIGKDVAINVTTGLASDIMHSAKDSENLGDFAKQMGINAGLNIALGGATSIIPQFRVGRVADDVVENALRQNADDAARRTIEFPNAEQSGIDVINPNIRNADEAVENVARNVDEAMAEPPSLNEVETAPPKIEEVETTPPPLEEPKVLGNGKNTYQILVYDGYGKQELLTVRANKGSEAVEIASDYGVPRGMNWTSGAKKVSQKPKVETTPPKLKEANEPFVARAEDYINELNSWRGETYLGSYGHITKNADGTYNLFRNGVGDTTLTEKEALDYIDAAVKRINADEEAIRVTRTSPLSDAENARIAEIDNEVTRLEAEGKEAADNLKNNKYKDVEKYWDAQGERGQKITDLTREKEQINIKEPAATTPKNADRDVHEVLRDKNVSLADKEAALDARVEELDKALENAGNRMNDTRLAPEVREAAQKEYDDIVAEIKQLSDEFNSARTETLAPRASTGNDRTADELITAIEDFDGEALALEQQIRNESGDTRRELERRLREHKQKNGLDNYVLTPAERESLLQRKNELLEYNKTHPEEIYTANRWENSDRIDVIDRLLSVKDTTSAPKTQLKAELDSVQKELDELPFTEENFGRREELTKRRAEIDELLKGSDIVDESVRPTGAAAQNEVNKDIQKAAKKGGTEWGNGENYEGYSVKEVQEMRAAEKTEGEIRTKRGAVTIATGMGDAHFATGMRESLESGEFDRNVRHNIQEYDKGVKRFVKYIEGKGGKDGKESISDLITRFNNFAKSNKPMTSNEMRDQLYDILVAVDWANANKDNPLSEQLFMAATRAGAEQSSVGGLTLYQWHRIAMSSPEHRAKVVKEQIENMFNSSRKFRKKYLGSVKKKLGDKFSAVGDDLPLDKFMEENPEVSKGMKAAYERLEKATSKDEVETAASEFLLEARKVMPVTAFDQLTQWRYVAMLSSPKTHIKNVVGNLYSGTLGQMSVAMSSSMENRLAKELNLTTTKNVDLSKGIAADQDLYLKSASGLSNKARTNAKKGVFEGIELRNAKSKLKDAERKLAIAEEGADTTELKKQVKELTEKVAEAQKNFDTKKIKAEDDLLGAKAQDLFHTKSVEQLIQDATKWEKQTYGAVSGGLEKASNFIGGALETSDAVAVERIYRETAEKILKANDYERFVKLAEGEGKEAAAAKAICDRIEEYAAEHAAYRAALDTYRNYNAVATWMNKVVKNTLYNADAKWYKKAGGFALHAVMPFTKVPTNIMKRSFDYSPAGLIQGKKMLDAAIESGNYAEINKAVERLAEGRIGTGIAALGMAMGMLDPDGMIVTTRLNRKDERDKAKKDRGYMDYSMRGVNIKESVKQGKYVPSNRDYTLEWATPTASDFFVGVETGRMLNNIYQKFADGNGLDFDPSKALEASGEILTRLVEPTLQLGMFQGVNSILEDSMEQRYDEANINPLFKAVGAITKNYVSSMTPSVLRSLSKAFAKSDYYISGKNDLDYRKNLLISKIPGVSAQMLDAKTNAWGEIKNERSDPKERVLRGAETLLAPWNSSEITWDDTDTKLYEFAEEYKKAHPKAQTLDFLPKVFYDNNNEGLTFGKNADTATHIELSNNDAAQYNLARGKAGEDAMAAALESVIFNRWYKDEKGKYTIEDSKNYTPEMKAKKIAEFKGKGTKDVVAWVMDQPEFKNATSAEQAQILREVIGNSGKDTSIGAKRTSELAVAKRHDISEEEYNYKNEVPAKAQAALDEAIAAGIVTYKQATDFARDAGKTYYRTDQNGEEGGSVQTYYNKREMMEYLADKGYSYEEAEALYNAFKSANAKDFNGIDTSSGRGRRRYGYRHYRRRGRGGSGSSAKAKVPAPKKISASKFEKGEALITKKRGSSSSGNSNIALKRVEAKIALPTDKYSTKKKK